MPGNTSPAVLLEAMISAALAAGAAILDEYEKPNSARAKPDGSPVTDADQRAERIIIDALTPFELPILAEESAAAGHIPVLGNRFFVVDPLDGTKEFIKRNGEFTVNIALIENNYPVLGVVTAPALGRGYYGSHTGAGAFEIVNGKAETRHPVRVGGPQPVRLATSRSHRAGKDAGLAAELEVDSEIHIGSSLKFCLIAENRADLYTRLSPTCEWDTAAGQAVLEAAGGTVLALDGQRLAYNKGTAKFLNPWFVAAASDALARSPFAAMRRRAT